jgi:hypothetical protein
MKKLLLLFIILAALWGCHRKQLQVSSQGKDSTHTRIIERERVLLVPGETIHNSVNLDSLKKVFSHPLPRPVVITTARAELRYWIDEAGRLRQECQAKDTTIRYMEREFYQLRHLIEKSNKHEVKTVRPWELYGLIAALVLLIIFLLYTLFKL